MNRVLPPPTTDGDVLTLNSATAYGAEWVTPGGGGGGGATHPTLGAAGLVWTASAHTGTASRVAGFSGAGAATYYQIGAAGGLQAWDADLDALAALGNGIALRTGGTWTAATASTVLDSVGSTRGAVLYRGAAGWAILAPGTSGDVLTSNGAGADPTYTTPSGGSGLTHGGVKRRLLALG